MSWLEFIMKILLVLPEIIKIIMEFQKNDPSRKASPPDPFLHKSTKV